MADTVLLHIDEQNIATLTLNRPEVHNAFDDALIASLTQQLHQLDKNPQVRVVVLTAAGKHFCAGADVGWMQHIINCSKQENQQDAVKLAQLMSTLNHLSKPTIALIQGAAFGGGVGLTACCDIVIASQKASFCLSEVRLGVIPAVISPYVIAKMGASAARRYFLTAERFSADTAKQLGLVHEVVAEDALRAKRVELTHTLLQNSPKAITAAKELIQTVAYTGFTDKLMTDITGRIANIRTSPEGQEGLKAFLEKRQPQWRKE